MQKALPIPLLALLLAGRIFGQADLTRAAEEFKIATRELGLRADSPVKVKAQKSRISGYHGRLFHNLRNDVFDAIPHEIAQRGGGKNFLRRNQFGFNLSGPVWIPKLYDGGRKTFFSVNYEGVQERIGRNSLRTVAIAPERAGDFSSTVDNAGAPLPIYDPATTAPNPAFNAAENVTTSNLQYLRTPFPGNQIPASRLDPVAQKAVSFYPLPNANAGPFFRNNYFVVSPESNRAHGMIFRTDYSHSDKQRFSGLFSFTNGFAGASRLMPTIADPGSNDRTYAARRLTLDYNFTRNPNSVNTLTFDIIRDRNLASREGETTAAQQIGLRGPLELSFPIFRFGEYLGMGRANPVTRTESNTYRVIEGFSLRRGKNNLRFSALLNFTNIDAFLSNYPAGIFGFSAGLTSLPGIVNTGHSFASFLLGGAASGEVSIVPVPSYWRRKTFNLTVRDTYEVRKNLTITVGIGLEGSTPRREVNDRFSSVDLTLANPENGRPGALAFANRNGRGRSFQPFRLVPEGDFSLAWNPGGNARNVVRLAYATSYQTVPTSASQWSTQGFNGTPAFISPNTQLQPAVVLQNGVPTPERPLPDLSPTAANNTVADLVEPTATQPFYQSASLSLERELRGQTIVALSLAHSRGQRLFVGGAAINLNAIRLENLEYRDQLNNEAFRRTLRPYPQYQGFDTNGLWPGGNYKRNAANLRVEKRSSAGLNVTASYEFSKQMDDYSGPYGTQDFYNKQNEWSLTAYNNPHRVSLSYTYELPIGSRKALFTYSDWRRYMVDGWAISGITTLLSGEPLAIHPLFNNTGGLVQALRVNLVPGVDPAVPNQSPDLWFNPAAFSQPPDFTIGDGPRTHPQLRNPSSQNHDLSVSKRIPIDKERALELQATGFNFINNANWTYPDTAIGTPTAPNVNAGRIIGSRGGRVIQVGMRLSF